MTRLTWPALLLASACGGQIATLTEAGTDAPPSRDASSSPLVDAAPPDPGHPDASGPPGDGGDPFAIACNVYGTYNYSQTLASGPVSYCTTHWANAPKITTDILYFDPARCTGSTDTPTCTQNATCSQVMGDTTVFFIRKISFASGGNVATGTFTGKEVFSDGGVIECVFNVTYTR
jgi:hypothetical protein